MNIVVRQAVREHAPAIAQLIMMAMTDECCLYFCGEGRGLPDFYRMMTQLVGSDEAQYSYRNTLVALASDTIPDQTQPHSRPCGRQQERRVVGIAVSYDGGRLHELRRPFIEAARTELGRDHSDMDDETKAGELYLDSLAVEPQYRRCGIARRLVEATKQKADQLGLPQVGLLVDADNAAGQAFYRTVGFRYAGDSSWGGHPMKHLVL